MPAILPESPAELARVLSDCAARKQAIHLTGNGSKRGIGGSTAPGALQISTARLSQVLQYEPADLTISVQAGMPWAELQKTLAVHRQMVALDPPFAAEASVGGVIATNGSGPLRRAYGTARDLVIGMQFTMLDGRGIQSGGMVVKNVAGLDMAKLLIGSLGTLAVITSVNFRIHSKPERNRTFLFKFASIDDCIEKRNTILQSVLQPEIMDVFSPVAAARLDLHGYVLALRAGGSKAVLDRYSRELPGAAVLEEKDQQELWQKVREFTPDFLRRTPSGVVLRVSTTIQEMRAVLKAANCAVIARAGSGVSYVYLNSPQAVMPFWKHAAEQHWHAVVEFAPEELRTQKESWLGGDSAALDLMRKIKLMFDPETILNPGRLYARL